MRWFVWTSGSWKRCIILALAYERAEKYAEAVQQFEQIVSYNEKYRDAAEHLANCRAGL